MAVVRMDGFDILQGSGIVDCVGIDSSRVEECVQYIRRTGAMGVFGSLSTGFRQDNLDFLLATPAVVQVWFWDCPLSDVKGLYALEGLRYLNLQVPRPPIDFTRFRSLELLMANWCRLDAGIAECSASKFYLRKANPKSRRLADIEIPIACRQLDITFSNVDDLTFQPQLTSLRECTLCRCRNLVDVTPLLESAPNLERLVVVDCHGVLSNPILRCKSKLRYLLVNGAVLVDQ